MTLETIAEVVAVSGGMIHLDCPPATGGRTCGRRCACALRLLGAGQGRSALLLPGSPRTADLVAGDTVIVSVRDGILLKAAGRVYLWPLAGLLAGPLLFRSGGLSGDGWVLLGALSAGLVGYLFARSLNRRAGPIAEIYPADSNPGVECRS
jgi:positive regulator of sigma E activity